MLGSKVSTVHRWKLIKLDGEWLLSRCIKESCRRVLFLLAVVFYFLYSSHSWTLRISVMTSKLAFLLSLTLNALLPTNALRAPQNGTIKWLPCKQNGTLPVTCATLKVPLDYSDPTSNATLDLSLVKVSAVKQPCKGSILFNPGGPGEGGVSFINGAVAEPLLV